jgi:hypothetical protein
VEDGTLHLEKVLWDSGAVDGSYVSKEWVDQRRAMLQPYLRRVQGMVRMGDNATLVPIREILRADVRFNKPGTKEMVTGRVDMAVMPTNGGLDAIMGLPDILRDYLDVFVSLLTRAEPYVSARPELYMLGLEDLKEKYPDVQDSWSQPPDELAPEELESEDMHAFMGPLYYLTKPYDEVLEDYHRLLETHVAPEWKEDERLMTLLTSAKAIQVFNPKEWTGITGLAPIELEFSKDMPEVHRPKIHAMNPKVREKAILEYDRLCVHFYEPSTSPIASPLVVAKKATPPFVRLCGDYRWVNQYLLPTNYYIPHVMKSLEKAAGYKYYIDIDLKNAFHQLTLSVA